MRQGPEASRLLDQQLDDYRALHALGLQQRSCLEEEDLKGLQEVFARVHRLMEGIRMRQGRLEAVDRRDPGVRERLSRVQLAIQEVEVLRQDSQEAAQRLLERTREELNRLGQGRRAARGYQGASPARARLFDGVR